jgi:hypothetical protein
VLFDVLVRGSTVWMRRRGDIRSHRVIGTTREHPLASLFPSAGYCRGWEYVGSAGPHLEGVNRAGGVYPRSFVYSLIDPTKHDATTHVECASA